MLRMELNTELGDKVELRLEKIDGPFLVSHQFLEQIAARMILDRMTSVPLIPKFATPCSTL